MTNEMDLWPDDIGETDLVPPVAVLREQAALLGKKTRPLVRARVESSGDGEMLHHTFTLTAPALDYRLELFTVVHPVSFYPMMFFWRGERKDLSTPEEFMEHLKTVLQSNDTKKVVHSLLAQVRTMPASRQGIEITEEDIPF